MSACNQSVALLKQLRAEILKLGPKTKELRDLLVANQNDGDPCFTEASWGAASAVCRSLQELRLKLDAAIEAGEVTRVGRRRKR